MLAFTEPNKRIAAANGIRTANEPMDLSAKVYRTEVL